jgi:hypothetical protein
MPKLIRRIALLVASMLMLTGLPAQAGTHTSKLCWPIWQDGQVKIYCVDIQVEWPWEWYLECYVCGAGIDWSHDPVIREDLESLVSEEIVTGLQTLGAAEFTRDPAQRAKLENEALNTFTAAARHSGKSAIKPGTTGMADPTKNTLTPAGFVWLDAAAQDVADGITLLQRSIADPTAAPRLRALAAAEFAEAYDELSQQKAIGN